MFAPPEIILATSEASEYSGSFAKDGTLMQAM